MDKIIDGLYLGDIQGASNLFMLKRNVYILLFNFLGYNPYLASSSRFQTFFPRSNIQISYCYRNLSIK